MESLSRKSTTVLTSFTRNASASGYKSRFCVQLVGLSSLSHLCRWLLPTEGELPAEGELTEIEPPTEGFKQCARNGVVG